MKKFAQFAAFYIIQNKIFPGGMPPDPTNLLICPIFLALAAVGPLQCERLESPVVLTADCLPGSVNKAVIT